MKNYILAVALLFCTLALRSQLVYHDASAFPLLGKATQNSAPAMRGYPIL